MSRIKNIIRNINYLSKHSLWDMREQDIIYMTNKILDDAVYEFDLKLLGKERMKILDKTDSLRAIRNSHRSFVRFGDGEIRLMMGESQPFQKYDKELVEKLYQILKNDNPNLLVGINRNYFVPQYNEKNSDYNRRNSYDFRKFLYKNANIDEEYLDGAVTFFGFGDYSTEAEHFWRTWKEMFKSKKIAVVAGKGVLDSLDYDVFELSSEKVFIWGKNKNAWEEHETIINEIKENIDRSYLIVFILGMAGKAMIPELVKEGYCAWDVGHLAKSYDAYMKRIEYSKESVARFYAPD